MNCVLDPSAKCKLRIAMHSAYERSNPSEDSPRWIVPKLDFSHLRTKGVRYAGHRSPPKEAIDAYPTGRDDTGFDPLSVTVLQARLAACPGAFGGRDPCPRKEDRKLCLARNGVG